MDTIKWEDLCGWNFFGYEAVKFLISPVPFHGVQGIPFHVIITGEHDIITASYIRWSFQTNIF